MARPEPSQRLPGVLGDIARIAGEDAALAIAEARGGTQVYIPPEPPADHWLSKLVGREASKEIAALLTCGVGGLRVVLPTGPAGSSARTRAKVDALILEGRSERDIALATGYTTRSVRRRRAMIGSATDRRQGDLFSNDD